VIIYNTKHNNIAHFMGLMSGCDAKKKAKQVLLAVLNLP